MSLISFEFDDNGRERAVSGFRPVEAYQAFITAHEQDLTFDSIRVFFLRAREAKSKLRGADGANILLTFGTWRVKVVNNHNPKFARSDIESSALTITRISGFLAKYCLDIMNGSDEETKALCKSRVLNPIAEARGITWDTAGPQVYLAFAPGTEMFLDDFKFLPLAIAIYRVQQKEMDPSFLQKVLRQYYGTLSSEEWMKQKKKLVKEAVARVSKLPWGQKGLSGPAKDFLKEFGIKV
ncbi:N [Guaratuba virus]|uniref:Nucleoprotein n=2 Tax=Orthobunyavirus TaxID=11572 RepID=A0A142K3K0_9VIRU|nr:nucleocapsid protein N [Enseada virus]AMR98955.1 nucleocapsid protein N [Enseada virus]QLA47071.1 N [Guaratuba virus] [Guaratuba virus]